MTIRTVGQVQVQFLTMMKLHFMIVWITCFVTGVAGTSLSRNKPTFCSADGSECFVGSDRPSNGDPVTPYVVYLIKPDELQSQWPYVAAVFSTSLAHNRATFSSTNGSGSSPARAVDGDFNPVFTDLSCWEAAGGDMNPFWMVDLGADYVIQHVNVTNRIDCCSARLHSLQIMLYSQNPVDHPGASSTLCAFYPGPVGGGATQSISCADANAIGRFVKINGLNRIDNNDQIQFCEVTVSGSPVVSCVRSSYMNTEATRTILYEHVDTLDNAGLTRTIASPSLTSCGASCLHDENCCYFRHDISTGECHIYSYSAGDQVTCLSHESCYTSL